MRVFKKASVFLLIFSMATQGFATSFAHAAAADPGDGHGGGHGGSGGGNGGGHGGGNPGGGHTPPPAPTPTVTPTPTPTPVPTVVGPTQDEINAARALGEEQGSRAGAREAQDRAPEEGRREGRKRGREEGFERCQKEEIERNHDAGFQSGYGQGQAEGTNNGNIKGQEEGKEHGLSEGRNDGFHRADNDSRSASAGPGQTKGYAQANASDASSSGTQDGIEAGDSDARSTALESDYPRGKRDAETDQQNDPVLSQDAFSQKPAVAAEIAPARATFKAKASLKDLVASFTDSLSSPLSPPDHDHGDDGDEGARGGNASPDHRYFNPSANFRYPEQVQAYKEAYSRAYDSGFESAYRSDYTRAYNSVFHEAEEEGCNEARRGDYRDAFQRGAEEGRAKGYASTYQPAYDNAYQSAFAAYFRSASDSAYSSNYDALYNQHFEEARSAAYNSLYNQLYNSAKQTAHDQKFAEVYPGYAESFYQQGRKDVAADYAKRPVRLLKSEVTETIVNGLDEPGEALRIRLSMRNFAASALAGRDIQVTLEALDASSAVITTAQETLVQNLNPKSITTVSEALEFHMNENAVNQARQFRVTLTYQGRNVGEQILNITARFMLDLQYAQSLQLKEGLEAPIQVRVRNQSNVPTDAGLKVTFTSDPNILQVVKGEVQVGVLQPGESRVIEFTAIDRGTGSVVEAPMVFQASTAEGRRVGLIDGEQRIPLVNDYRISLSTGAGALRSNGVTRVQYTITNVSSRLLLKGMQLKVSVLGDASKNFVVIGPNPQYLTPLIQGQSLSFEVPILVTAGNSGGTLQLELQEDGRTVVINRTDF